MYLSIGRIGVYQFRDCAHLCIDLHGQCKLMDEFSRMWADKACPEHTSFTDQYTGQSCCNTVCHGPINLSHGEVHHMILDSLCQCLALLKPDRGYFRVCIDNPWHHPVARLSGYTEHDIGECNARLILRHMCELIGPANIANCIDVFL